MNISESNHARIFNFFLVIISLSMILRKPCTLIIILFSLYQLLNYKKLCFSKKALCLASLVAAPLLMEILFFWNNDSYSAGFKSLEKSMSLLVFPLFIIGNKERIDFKRLVFLYGITTPYIVTFFLIRFYVCFPEMVNKYLNGIDLWEAGYAFARSFGTHAPWLNMHLSFVSAIDLLLVVFAFQQNWKWSLKLITIVTFVLSFLLILIVNTRMALFDSLACFLAVFAYDVFSKYNFKSALKWISILLTVLLAVFVLYLQQNSYMREKYFSVTFKHMDKIGKLDEVENPELEVFNSFVTRVSIWKSALELSVKNLPMGVGASDAKPQLLKYYKKTNQKFLAKWNFPTHNQYIDYMLRYGILGIIVVFGYIFLSGIIGFKLKNSIMMSFFIIFFTSNIIDDYLILFQGIAFAGFWLSIFMSFYLIEKPQNNRVHSLNESR